MTLHELVKNGENILQKSGDDDYKIDAWLLIEHITGLSHADFFLCRDDDNISVNGLSFSEIEEKYNELVNRRASHVPLAYIVNEVYFCGLPFYVDENVLIPEQDTETMIEEVLKEASGKSILDLCTGSGCIAIALAKLGKPASVTASDISGKALSIAKRNAEKNDVKINFILSDLFDNIDGKFDIIVSNPPYIKSSVISTLAPEVKDHEPLLALDGSDDGLYFYRKISEKLSDHLRRNGRIFYEIGYDEADAVSQIFAHEGFDDIKVIKDLGENDRVVCGTFL